MKEYLKLSGTFRVITLILTAIGIGAFIAGILSDPKATWACYLITNYYFLSLSIGAVIFLVLQSVSQSGWSSGFIRVPEAMMAYIPLAFVFFILLIFGMKELYPWSDPAQAGDHIIHQKSAFLNQPFFFIRLVIYFLLWIIFTQLIRSISLKMDMADPSDQKSILSMFGKTELYSKILIFILILTLSLSAFEWIMSIDVHWYSTIFALKNIVAAFLHGVSVLTLIVFILHKLDYFPFLNKYHLHDFARYIFMLSIIWGYFWFAQFMIIWYGNIPEETAYYYVRWQEGWKTLFFVEIGLNWAVPFLVLLPVTTSRNKSVIMVVILILMIGQYVDLFVQVIPGTSGALKFGWIEISMFLGYAGLFSLVVSTALSKAKIIPVNHPYLDESIEHQF